MYKKRLLKGLIASSVITLAIVGGASLVCFNKISKANEPRNIYKTEDIETIFNEIYEEVDENMSSNPYDYIRCSYKYRKLLSLGKDGLPAMEEYIANNSGLDSYIVALAMEDIEDVNIYKETKINWTNGQEFLRAWRIYKSKDNYAFDFTKNDSMFNKTKGNKNKVTNNGKENKDEKVQEDNNSQEEIKYDYSRFYKKIICRDCEKAKYDADQLDSFKHKRMYGIRFCKYHQNKTSEEAEFVDYGYTDYNCLAYATGEIKPCNWMWPASWGDNPEIDIVKKYFEEEGYKTEEYKKENDKKYKEKKAIFVYAIKENNGDKDENEVKYRVVHFGRTEQIDGTDIGEYAEVSKWGMGGIYKTKNVDGFADKSGYGQCILVCYKG